MMAQLANGVEMPCIGMGTWPLRHKELIKAVVAGTSYGFKSIDAARDYGNEPSLAKALNKAYKINNISRNQLFITSKIGNDQQIKGNIKEELKETLNNLKTDYLDLWLLHWPYPNLYTETWKQMEELYNEGKVKAIGVCNFHIHHFEELFQISNIKPMVHQFEIHPLFTQEELRKFCINQDIQIMAYTPTGRCDDRLMNNGILNDISFRTNKTIVQVILRWHLQKGHIPVVRTFKVKHLKENINIFDFELSQKEIEQIGSININSRLRYDSDNCDFYRL